MNEEQLRTTPGQTVGPFFGYALPFPGDNQVIRPDRPEAIRLHGTVFDGAGAGVPDALLEIWQPDAAGLVPVQSGSLHRGGYGFTGWGRAATDRAGEYSFSTVAPGVLQASEHAFIAVTIFARGLLDCLFTRIYLPDTGIESGQDPFFASLDQDRRRTLVAVQDGPASYRFDVHFQGEDETVFLDFCGDGHE